MKKRAGDVPNIGPITMMFEGSEAAGGSPRYRFDHANGEGHAGTYVFEAVDTTRSSLVLYPDSSGPFHADLIDEAIVTDYMVKAGRIDLMRQRHSEVFVAQAMTLDVKKKPGTSNGRPGLF